MQCQNFPYSNEQYQPRHSPPFTNTVRPPNNQQRPCFDHNQPQCYNDNNRLPFNDNQNGNRFNVNNHNHPSQYINQQDCLGNQHNLVNHNYRPNYQRDQMRQPQNNMNWNLENRRNFENFNNRPPNQLLNNKSQYQQRPCNYNQNYLPYNCINEMSQGGLYQQYEHPRHSYNSNKSATRFNRPYQPNRNNSPQTKHTSTQQPKKLDVSPSTLFRCEACERNFVDELALNAHLKGHVQCEEPGCTFKASSKALKLHFVQKHAEGRFRIVLQTPEEIAKWREDRKRNWPSTSNIKNKKKKMEDKKTLGINLDTTQFSYRGNENKKGKVQSSNKQNRTNNNEIALSHQKYIENKIKATNGEALLVSHDSKKLGGLAMLHSYDDEDSDNESSDRDLQSRDIKTPITLQQDLEDGELTESEGEAPEKCPGRSSQEDRTQIQDQCTSSQEQRTLSPDQSTPSSQDQCTPSQHRKNRKNNRSNKNKKQKKNQQKEEVKKNVSLLEMLLAKEIRHERNVVLQCVRHIANQNFFD